MQHQCLLHSPGHGEPHYRDLRLPLRGKFNQKSLQFIELDHFGIDYAAFWAVRSVNCTACDHGMMTSTAPNFDVCSLERLNKGHTHQVSLLGWGTEETTSLDPVSNATVTVSTRYWLLRNWWGRYYADDGWFRVRRDPPNNYSPGSAKGRAWGTPVLRPRSSVPFSSVG